MSGSKGSDHWRLCDEFSVAEAAHLITDPSSIDSKIKPPGYEAALTALQRSIRSNSLPARIRQPVRYRGLDEEPGDGERYAEHVGTAESDWIEERGPGGKILPDEAIYARSLILRKEPDWDRTTVRLQDLREWLASAASLSLLRGADGSSLAYPTMAVRNGTLCGLPVIASPACSASGSPGERFVVLLEASEVQLADDGEVDINIAKSAAVQLNDAPGGDPQQLTSLWSLNLLGVRARLFCNWLRRHDGAVVTLRDVTY